MRRARTILALTVVTAALATPAVAQFRQYQPAGDFGDRSQEISDVLEDAIENARWRVGRVYFHPWAALDDVSYIDNVAGRPEGAEESDITASVGLGVRAYMPFASDLVLAGYALPEYVWWNELSGRSRLNGRYGVGLFGSVRGLDLELSVGRTERSEYFSREQEDRVNSVERSVEAGLEVALGGGVALFFRGAIHDVGFREEDTFLQYSLLDRDEEALSAGIAYESQRGFRLGIGAESTTTDFDVAGAASSNEGVSGIVEVGFDAPTHYVQIRAARRDLEARTGASFVDFEDWTGSAQAAWIPVPPFQLQLFVRRDLVYSIDPATSYFRDASVGLATQFNLGRVPTLRIFAEEGDLEFTALQGGAPPRVDDFEALGAELQLDLGRVQLFLGSTETQYESSLPGFDREITVTTFGISFGTGSDSPWG